MNKMDIRPHLIIMPFFSRFLGPSSCKPPCLKSAASPRLVFVAKFLPLLNQTLQGKISDAQKKGKNKEEFIIYIQNIMIFFL